jgi:hypothetical protein
MVTCIPEIFWSMAMDVQLQFATSATLHLQRRGCRNTGVADGKHLKSELDFIRDFFKRQFGEVAAAQQLPYLTDLLNKDIPVKEVCEQIRYFMIHQKDSKKPISSVYIKWNIHMKFTQRYLRQKDLRHVKSLKRHYCFRSRNISNA